MVAKLKEIEKPNDLNLNDIAYQYSNIYSTRDFGRYNPDNLIIKKGAKVYEAMRKDEQVKAVLQFKKYAVVSRAWYFDVDEENTEHQEISDFFYYVIKSIQGNFTDKLIGILSALQNGFSVSEKTYTPIMFNNKAYWGIKDIKLKPFETFDGGFITDDYGNIKEIAQISGISVKNPIPMDKIIHFVYNPDIDNCYGESDLRACYRAWWSKDITIKFLNIFLERSAGGFLEFRKKGQISPTGESKLKQLADRITALTSLILPQNVELTWHSPKQNDMFEKAIVIYDKAIAKAILVPNLLGLSEQGQTGSYSQSQTQFNAFMWIAEAIGNSLAETLNEQVFKQLAIWNFGTEDFPLFCFEPMSDDIKNKLLEAWGNLVQKGAVKASETDEAYIRNILGMPEKAEEEEPSDDMPVIEPEQTPEKPDETEEPEEALPDNEDWIATQTDANIIRLELAEKPWLQRIDFAAQESAMDRRDAEFDESLSDTMAAVKESLFNQIRKTIGNRSLANVKPKEIEEIQIPKKVLSNIRKAIRAGLTDSLDTSYMLARKELPKKKFKVVDGIMDKTTAEAFLSSKAVSETKVINDDAIKELRRILDTAIQYDYSMRETLAALENSEKFVALLPKVDAAGRAVNIPARIETITRTLNSNAWNLARTSLFNQPDFKGYIQAYEYSAVLDNRTSEICNANHGRIRIDWGSWTPPNHYNCRSMLIPVTITDNWEGKQDALTQAGQPLEGFGIRLK